MPNSLFLKLLLKSNCNAACENLPLIYSDSYQDLRCLHHVSLLNNARILSKHESDLQWQLKWQKIPLPLNPEIKQPGNLPIPSHSAKFIAQFLCWDSKFWISFFNIQNLRCLHRNCFVLSLLFATPAQKPHLSQGARCLCNADIDEFLCSKGCHSLQTQLSSDQDFS